MAILIICIKRTINIATSMHNAGVVVLPFATLHKSCKLLNSTNRRAYFFFFFFFLRSFFFFFFFCLRCVFVCFVSCVVDEYYQISSDMIIIIIETSFFFPSYKLCGYKKKVGSTFLLIFKNLNQTKYFLLS